MTNSLFKATVGSAGGNFLAIVQRLAGWQSVLRRRRLNDVLTSEITQSVRRGQGTSWATFAEHFWA
jgi:hypothetical protein